MPSLSNKALLCQLEVFVADNAIRRGVLLATSNAQSEANAINDVSITLDPSGSAAFSPFGTNKTTIIKATGGPATVTIKFGAPAEVDTLQAVTFTVDGLTVLPTQVASLQIANPNATSLQIRVIHV